MSETHEAREPRTCHTQHTYWHYFPFWSPRPRVLVLTAHFPCMPSRSVYSFYTTVVHRALSVHFECAPTMLACLMTVRPYRKTKRWHCVVKRRKGSGKLSRIKTFIDFWVRIWYDCFVSATEATNLKSFQPWHLNSPVVNELIIFRTKIGLPVPCTDSVLDVCNSKVIFQAYITQFYETITEQNVANGLEQEWPTSTHRRAT